MLYKLTHNNNNISVINWYKRKPHFGPSTNNYTPPIPHTLKHNFKISNFLICILTQKKVYIGQLENATFDMFHKMEPWQIVKFQLLLYFNFSCNM